jgi:hypothetical protein
MSVAVKRENAVLTDEALGLAQAGCDGPIALLDLMPSRLAGRAVDACRP